MDADAAVATVLENFIFANCRLKDHPKLLARVWILEGGSLVLKARTGPPLDLYFDTDSFHKDSLVTRLVGEGRFWIGQTIHESILNPDLFNRIRLAGSFMSIPILDGHSAVGVVTISCRDGDFFGMNHLGRAQLLAALIAYIVVDLAVGRQQSTLISTTLGRALAQARDELGVSQSALANKMGRSRIALSRWECGAQSPTIGPLTEWCEALGVSCAASPSLVTVVDITSRLLPLLRQRPDSLRELSPSQFEQFIAERLDRMGFAVTLPNETTVRDGGIDLIAVPKLRTAASYLIAGQVKHHSSDRKTGRDAVDRLLSWQRTPFNLGLLITNTAFTRDALWVATREQNRSFLRLRDFLDLKRWLQDNFWDPAEWRELPDKVELAPGLEIEIPKVEINQSLSLWPAKMTYEEGIPPPHV
jgi:transcriptional regulator with XRE-family HTH domain